MKSTIESKFGVNGHLTMITKNRETGEIIDEFSEDNVITVFGFSELLSRFNKPTADTSISGSYLYTIKLGDDVGTGTLLVPEDANESLLSVDQSVVYTVPNTDMVLTYLSSKEFKYSTVLNGQTILDTYYPTDIEMRYTSATMRLFNDGSFSYKRFPVRSLSRLVDIDITWTFTFAETI